MCCVFLSLPHHHLFFLHINRLHASSPPSHSSLTLVSSSTKARMPQKSSSSSSIMVKHEFCTKWKKGLQIYSAFNKEMTIMERKKAIKLSADVAIAATRSATTQWSRAVVADVSSSAAGAARIAAEEILGRKLSTERSKKIVRRRRRRRKAAARGAAVAKRVVWNRRRVLKRLIPGSGWKKLDEISFIKETLDYIASLQVQVDVMRHLANAAETCLHHQQILL